MDLKIDDLLEKVRRPRLRYVLVTLTLNDL